MTRSATSLSLCPAGPGRALWVTAEGRMFVSRGYEIHASNDDGVSWQRVTSLPVSGVRRAGRYARLAARLLRFEVRALGVLEGGGLVAANREGLFFGRAGDPALQPSRVEDAGQPVKPPMTLTTGPDDHVLFGEYNPQTGHGTPVRIYASDDGGRSFGIVHTLAGGDVMHIHSLLYDPGLDHYWVFAGDYGDEAGMGLLSRDLKHFQWLYKGEQRYRVCEAFDFGDRLVYATDTPLEHNAILSMDKNTGKTERLGEVAGSCLYACRFGGVYAFSTTVEPGAVDVTDRASLWLSRDGARWERVFEARKDPWPSILQFGSLILPRGASGRETLLVSGQAVRRLDGRAWIAPLQSFAVAPG